MWGEEEEEQEEEEMEEGGMVVVPRGGCGGERQGGTHARPDAVFCACGSDRLTGPLMTD